MLRLTTAHALFSEASGPRDWDRATQKSQPAQATRHRGSGVLEQLPDGCGTQMAALLQWSDVVALHTVRRCCAARWTAF